MKIIASDYDGTISYRGMVSEEDKAAIKKFRASGNKFGIVTGRDVEVAQWIGLDGFEYDFIISCTGAFIRGSDGEVLYCKKGKTGEFIEELINKAKELKVRFFTIGDVLEKHYLDVSGKIPPTFHKLSEFTHANANFPSDEIAQQFTDYVNTNYSDKISAYRNGCHVDMPPAGTSKVSGIYVYAERFENPEIYTVGDNFNDLPMIKEFCGYAVSNAVDSLKAAAKRQCGRICDMIEELLKGDK